MLRRKFQEFGGINESAKRASRCPARLSNGKQSMEFTADRRRIADLRVSSPLILDRRVTGLLTLLMTQFIHHEADGFAKAAHGIGMAAGFGGIHGGVVELLEL